MRISVVVAAHNEGAWLWRTVQSCVETCSHLNYEIVVADDASDDSSVEELKRRFPQVKVVRHDRRQGASPTKALGADHAIGNTLVFLDGHTKPEYGAIARLAEDVELLEGRAVVIPQIPTLDPARWKNDFKQAGHGYYLDLATFACGWRELSKLRVVTQGRKQFYESPALIGCALAVDRELYDKLWGFDRHMQLWGVEDLDFGLKCWLMGYRILHDPQAVIGHRFREAFDNYSAPLEHVLANQLRMARKNFTQAVWADWVDRSRQRNPERLAEHPEGLWAHVWHLFEADQASADHERAYLHANRVHDEFWYADRFGLKWPRLETGAKHPVRLFETEPSPSPPPTKCRLDSISADQSTVCADTPVTFTAKGDYLTQLQWSAPGGNPATGSGATFVTQFSSNGKQTVTAQCPSGAQQSTTVTVNKVDFKFSKTDIRPGIAANRAEKVTITASRSGGGEALKINVKSSDPRATVSPASFTLPAGQDSTDREVTVQGVTLSGANNDTQLTASVDKCPQQKGNANVTVVEPRNWTCTGLGGALTSSTPTYAADTKFPPPNNFRVYWSVDVVFTFLDRFSQRLHPQWADAPAATAWECVGANPCTGFDPDHPGSGTPLDALAQIVDTVVMGTSLMSEDSAKAIAEKAAPSPPLNSGTVISYMIDDAGTTYNLAMENLRTNAVDTKWTMTVRQAKVP